MLEELRTGSSRGIALEGVTFWQKAFSTAVALAVSALLIIIPYVVL